MKKIDSVLTSKIYEVKHQYPAIRKFKQRIDTVKKELNKDIVRHK